MISKLKEKKLFGLVDSITYIVSSNLCTKNPNVLMHCMAIKSKLNALFFSIKLIFQLQGHQDVTMVHVATLYCLFTMANGILYSHFKKKNLIL